MYLLNSFSVNMLQIPARVFFDYFYEFTVKYKVANRTFISAIGHESTAKVLSEKLGVDIPFNRMDVKLKQNDEGIICQLPHPEEGQVYSEEEIKSMEIKYVYFYVENMFTQVKKDTHKNGTLFKWPEVFDTKDISSRTDEGLLIDGLLAWGNCFAGEIHPNFGEVIEKIALRLHISGTPESFQEKEVV